jgi:hypothetical protein
MTTTIDIAPESRRSDTGEKTALGVHSEVGLLRQVIIHRPGLELSRLTPHNREELLFDDVLWPAKARSEHDGFADALTSRGIEVHHFGDLLSETLDIPEARDYVLDRLCNTVSGRRLPRIFASFSLTRSRGGSPTCSSAAFSGQISRQVPRVASTP